MSDGMKLCKACNEWLPIEEFCRDRTRPDGHFYYCRQCNAKRNKETVCKTTQKLASYGNFPLTSPCDNCDCLPLCRVEVWRKSFKLPCSPENKIGGNIDMQRRASTKEKEIKLVVNDGEVQ